MLSYLVETDTKLSLTFWHTHFTKMRPMFLIKGQIRVGGDENLSPLAYYLVKSIPLSCAQYQVDLTSKMIFIPKCSLGFVRN